MRALIAGGLVVTTFFVVGHSQSRSPVVRFAFTSDAHYGLTRRTFRGHTAVSAHDVNAALVSDLNSLATLGPFDFVVEGGDVANRAEADEHVQAPSVSWAQFKADYVDGLTLHTSTGATTPVWVVPGNHDASNAIGFYRQMLPAVDKTPMAEIYNLMMAPAHRTAATFDYASDRVLTSRDVGGVHLVFLTVWPDSMGRTWLARDLEHVAASTPVVVFTHDQPDARFRRVAHVPGRLADEGEVLRERRAEALVPCRNHRYRHDDADGAGAAVEHRVVGRRGDGESLTESSGPRSPGRPPR